MTLGPDLEPVFGSPVVSARKLQGGDLSEVLHVWLENGRDMAVKRGPLVEVEARMLSAMATAGAPVPGVLHAANGVLCLEWLDEAAASPDGWRDLGRAMCALHGTLGDGYGWPEDYAFGSVAIVNTPNEKWPDFWADARLLPFLDTLPADLARRVEALARNLPNRLPDAPAPALLHGDLWGGNVLFSARGPMLIDPACYHGDAEVDLAMLELFGRPDPAFRDGYGPVAADRETRVAIYQLWPALVHLALFGNGYRGMVERLLDASRV